MTCWSWPAPWWGWAAPRRRDPWSGRRARWPRGWGRPRSACCARPCRRALALCRHGGWASAEQLGADGAVGAGRLWERLPAPELHFTLSSVELCRWLASAPLASPGVPHLALEGAELGCGDELLLYLACELARCCGCSDAVAASPAFRRSALCWVGFADLLARRGPPSTGELPDAAFTSLFAPSRVVLLEALQGDLARRWLEMERGKARLTGTERLLQVGQAQQRALDGLARAADAAGRRDLLGFVWRAGGKLLRHRPAAAHWLAALSPESSLAERSQACREGGAAFLRALLGLQAWVEEARSRRFFDDDYAAAQLLLRQWEELGTGGAQHAQLLVGALEALDAVAAGVAATEVTG